MLALMHLNTMQIWKAIEMRHYAIFQRTVVSWSLLNAWMKVSISLLPHTLLFLHLHRIQENSFSVEAEF